MSYPSVDGHLTKQGVTMDTATDDQMRQAFINAFKEDLPLGWAKVEELVDKLKQMGARAMLTLNPNSPEGKQFARLLAPDIPRDVLQRHFGVKFGFYNCCKGVAGREPDDLKMTLREQMEAQHPNFVDC